MARTFFPRMNLTHDDNDTSSRLSDTRCSLTQGPKVASTNCALVAFSQAEGDPIWNVPSLHPKSSALASSQYVPSGSPAVLGSQEAVQWITQRAQEAISAKWLQNKILSVLCPQIMKYTTTMCRYKFDSSNMKQMRDFVEDKGNCYLALRKEIKLLKISVKSG